MSYRIRKKGTSSPQAPTQGTPHVPHAASSGAGQIVNQLMTTRRTPVIVTGIIGVILLGGVGLVAHIYSDKKKTEQAAATLETKAEQAFSQSTQDKNQDMSNSEKMFQEVMSKYPDSSSAKVSPLFLASIENQKGNPQEALKWLHIGLEKNSGDTKILPFYYESLGVTFISTKQYDQALAMFQKVLKFPGKVLADAAYFNIGKIYQTLNQPALALLNFQTLVKQFPSSPWAAEAGAYMNQGNPTSAPPLTPSPAVPPSSTPAPK